MTTEPRPTARPWMALLAALLGWMFDGAEMGLFSMIGRKAIQDLLNFPVDLSKEQEGEIGLLFGVVIAVFLVGAATGGVLFGWLGDRIGRVRAMALSVVTYALFTGLCGVVDSPIQLAVLRFIASLGMGGEWSLGVALVMEVWPNRSRALMAGLIGAAANVGYLLVGVLGRGLNSIMGQLSETLPTIMSQSQADWLLEYGGWRILMMSGALPALLTFFIRMFVPESEKWLHEKESGNTSHWKTYDLLGVLIGSIGPAILIYCWLPPKLYFIPSETPLPLVVRIAGTIVGVLIAATGYTWPVVRYVQRTARPGGPPVIRRMLLSAGISGVALLGTWASTQWAPGWASKLTTHPSASADTQMALAIGAIIGTIAAALAGDKFGRRPTYFVMCAASLASTLYLFQANTTFSNHFLVCSFVAAVFTASFYGWLPLYLPELFETNVRATCQGFSFNFGRLLASIGTLQAGALVAVGDQQLFGYVFKGGIPLACSVMSLIYLVGMVLIWFVPETKGQPLPD